MNDSTSKIENEGALPVTLIVLVAVFLGSVAIFFNEYLLAVVGALLVVWLLSLVYYSHIAFKKE